MCANIEKKHYPTSLDLKVLLDILSSAAFPKDFRSYQQAVFVETFHVITHLFLYCTKLARFLKYILC